MLRKQHSKEKPKSRRVQFVGIVADSAALGVTRVHLWLVLTGRRESQPLLARYAALKRPRLAA